MPEYLFSKKESDYKRNALYHIGNTKFILLDINSFFQIVNLSVLRISLPKCQDCIW